MQSLIKQVACEYIRLSLLPATLGILWAVVLQKVDISIQLINCYIVDNM